MANAAQMAALHQKHSLEMLSPVSQITANAQGDVMLDFDLPMPAVSFVKLVPE
jgi:xylan 1,4-beta-xylosidase